MLNYYEKKLDDFREQYQRAVSEFRFSDSNNVLDETFTFYLDAVLSFGTRISGLQDSLKGGSERLSDSKKEKILKTIEDELGRFSRSLSTLKEIQAIMQKYDLTNAPE